jgi:K(+)-stimulated pyrophosphate-energized sodium pump
MQRSTSSKSIKYRELGFDRLTAYFLVDMLPETMKMNFGEGTKEISSMRVFMRQLLVLVVQVISSVTEYYTGLGTKPVMAIVQKIEIAGLATGMISTFQQYCYLQQFGLPFSRILWCCFASAMMATTAMQLH